MTSRSLACASSIIPGAARVARIARTSMLSFVAMAGLAALAAPDASAQIAAAIGRPLPVSSDATGTVTVRVVNGDPTAPAGGLDVTLTLGGTPRISRTSADGRATFAGVPPGAQALVTIAGKDGGQLASQPFEMPGSGGVRLLMSTTGTFGGAAAGGGAGATPGAGAPAGGAMPGAGVTSNGAPPSLRERSGGVIATPESAPDSLMLRLSYDDPADPSPPKDHPVYLVSYTADEKISVLHKATDAEGRVVFSGLDVSGATAYYVHTLLARGASIDRLMSGPLLPPGGAGLAMVLSADKRTSTAPPIDDVFALQRLEGSVPAGQVVIELQGQPELGKVSLMDAETGAELTSAAAVAQSGAASTAEQPSWPIATLDVTQQPAGRLVYAESRMRGGLYRSLPFQLVPDRGARASLLVAPRVMMRFSLTSAVDEDYFVFRGRFQLGNNSWFPYKASEDGLTMPLPKGFSGAQVTEEDAADISPVPGEGLRILRPLPPGGKQFIAGWSMVTTDGEVTWDLALPFELVQSGMEIIQPPGASVELPPGVQSKSVNVARGAYLVLPDISIAANQRMVLRIRGLPSVPAWKLWSPRIVGALAVLIIAGGLWFAFRGRGASKGDDADDTAVANQARIDALMDELVALEGSPDEERRAQVMAQLERLWPSTAAPAGAGDRASA
jgi:hypothetical protein